MDHARIASFDLVLTPVPRKLGQAAIEFLYGEESDEFFKAYHKRGGTLQQCVADTMKSISYNAEIYVLYVLDEGKKRIVAYFVKTRFKNDYVMEGFHISKPYRSKDVFNKFWFAVDEIFKCPIHIGILGTNEPALRHLKANGFEEKGPLESEGKSFILLVKPYKR